MLTRTHTGSLQFQLIEYGFPACRYIEIEFGIVPDTCLNEGELNALRHYRIVSLVQQTKADREQHYEVDGVSMSREIIVAGQLSVFMNKHVFDMSLADHRWSWRATGTAGQWA